MKLLEASGNMGSKNDVSLRMINLSSSQVAGSNPAGPTIQNHIQTKILAREFSLIP
jgi:hypothetical protein